MTSLYNPPSLQTVTQVGNTTDQGFVITAVGGKFNNNVKALFGTSTPQGSIYCDATDVVINPQEAGAGNLLIGPTANKSFRFNNCAAAGGPLLTNRIFSADATTSVFTQVFGASMTYTGVAASIRALSFTVTGQNSTGAPALTSFCISSINCNNLGNPTATGFSGTANVNAAQTITTFTSATLAGIIGQIGANANSHTGVNFTRTSILANDPGIYTTTGTDTAWAIRCEGDAQINDNKKCIFGGSSTVKASNFIQWTSASSRLDVAVASTPVISFQAGKLSVFNATPVVQYATTGTVLGFTAGAALPVLSDSTFTGNIGATAFTISDIVRCLKLYGYMAM